MPEGWRTITLADVLVEARDRVRVESNVEYPLAGVFGFGRGVLLRDPVLGSDISAQFLYRIRSGQLMYSRLKAFEGAFALVPAEADGRLVSNEFPTFDVDLSVASPQYLRLLLSRRRVWLELESGSQGMGARRERLQQEDFLDLELELPPLDVQERAVAAIECVDRALAEGERRARQIDAMFRAGATELFADIEGPDVRLGDVAPLSSGGTPSRANPANYGGDIPWAKTGEVRFNRLADTEEHITEQALATSSAKLLPAGTVLLAMYGQGATRGRCALLLREMATNQACAAILPTERLLPDYLFFFLRSRYEAIRAESEGSAQDNLNQGMVADIELPLPDVEVQTEVVQTLMTLRGAADARTAENDALGRLRLALLEDLVSGAVEAPLQAV